MTALPNRLRVVALLGWLLTGALSPSTSRSQQFEIVPGPRTLLSYVDDAGNALPVRTVDQWRLRRRAVLAAMQHVMGPLPGDKQRCPLDLRETEQVDCGTYVRRLISYQSEPNSRVPAYLLIPKKLLDDSRRVPAVLCLHPTDNQHGHKVVVGLGGKPNRQYAAELAERGYVTLAPAYPLLADYQPDLNELGYASGTMKAIWDNVRGVDLLQSLTYVDPNAIGVIGHSLGGHNGIYTAVFDKRIKVVVSSCGFDSFHDYMNGDIRGWTSTRYMPKLLPYRDRLDEVPFDFDELIAALAPRHCFVSAPLHDDNFKTESVRRIVGDAAAIYQLYDQRDRLTLVQPDCAHDFPAAVRKKAYALLDRVLVNPSRARVD